MEDELRFRFCIVGRVALCYDYSRRLPGTFWESRGRRVVQFIVSQVASQLPRSLSRL